MPGKAISTMQNNCRITQLARNTSMTFPAALVRRWRFGLKLSLIGLMLLTAGCATANKTGSESKGSDAQRFYADVITDMVSVLPQIYEPLTTTIQISDSYSGNAAAAAAALSDLGYGLQRVDADQGSHFLEVNELAGSTSTNFRMLLTIGNIELKRTYQVVNRTNDISTAANVTWHGNQAIVPVGPLAIAGTDQNVELVGINVELGNTQKPYNMASGSVRYTELQPIEGGIPAISLITDDLVSRVAAATAGAPSLASLRRDDGQFRNLFEGDPSHFAALEDNYNRILRETVVFPNDSQFLGLPGKLVVQKLVGRFSDNTDIVGIIGCSTGPTALEIGNEGLALGRANRIIEELVSAGVSPEKVLDEGCWSPALGDGKLPNRGVVIDLWRRAG